MTGPPDNFSHPAALPPRPPQRRGAPPTIGEALAQARVEAGLSIAQVSQKTRIREAIIRDIERDDYSSCGGDFYARGHIRAVARAAGADSEPLIRQYDAIRSGAGQLAPAEQAAPPDKFGPDGYGAPEEFGPDGFAASGGYGAPEEFGPGGSPPADEAGPDGFAASGGYGAPEEFGPGGFPPADEAGPDGYAAPEEFATGGFAAPEEFGPGGFPAPDYLGSGGFALSDEEEFAASGERGGPGEPEAPEEITSPNPVVTTSQMAAFEEIMATRPPAAPERTAPGVTGPGVARPGVAGPGVTRPRVAGPGVAGPAIRGRGGAAPDGTAPPRSHRTGPAGTARPGKPGRPDRTAVIAAVVALAIFGGLAFLLIPGSRSAPQAGAAATGPATHGRAASGGRHRAKNSPTATPRSASSAGPGARPALLTPARAVAFGRGGPAHGDNPQDASLAIDGRPRTAWQTDWYTTSHFGNLKAGTGLLLDMGHRVTITSARITLGRIPGADFQLRIGGSAALAGLRPVAHAINAHGLVRLQLARPAQARYVLIWFTQLPLDPAGTYQAKVYNVRLR